ncbi:DUF4097 family beta strand repeat protein [Streptomyces roseirectus]|uniref:DUF4097 family beta strand repeat protein n=1 Tax=Streptomyces roseirectus TaxID=2768066 RepID=A0A7H0IJI8_9ACTN|nr:DUF4097 family beta strand repeat-containing protein [Streptomyces roseirectus]QNP72954.1 DUF4097 family beta strand repeat protein [Streptomyces roseirectus]
MARTTRTRRLLLASGVALVAVLGTACANSSDDTAPESKGFGFEGSTLTIDSENTALEIVAAEDNKAGRVEVTRWFDGSVAVGKDPKLTWSMSDDRLKLRMRCTGLVANCSSKHRVEIPRGVAVKVVSHDGSVKARGLRNALDVRSSDGSVRITDTSGPLDLDTKDGSVRADVSSRTVTTRSSDGSVRLNLSAVPDRVDVKTNDGNVTIEVPKATYKVTEKVNDGDRRVSVPRADDSAHGITARVKDGDLTVRTAG